jgi:hypothetical protein
VLVVQSVSTANSSGTGNTVTPSNVARGAVVALITVAQTFDQGGHLQNSIIQTIALRGDGGSIQDHLPIGGSNTSPKVPIIPSITSTGPLGDLIVQGPLTTNVTAPSIFGSIVANGGSISSTIQTTGLRTDPITGAISQVPADLGRIYVTTTNQGPVVTTSLVQSVGSGLSGRVISRGNIISQLTSGGSITGLVAAQGNLGAFFAYLSGPRAGQVVRVGGYLSSGSLVGQLLIEGNAIGDIFSSGGMQGGHIAVRGSILGNLQINGTIDSQSTIVSGGSIGSTLYGTKMNSGNTYGIVAAVGPINAGTIGTTTGARYYKQNDTLDAAVIDAVFSQGVSPLSPADLFDQNALGDLLNLDQIILNLSDLTVRNGKLSLS